MIAKSIQLYLIKSFTNISVVLKRMNGCAFGIGRIKNITIQIESKYLESPIELNQSWVSSLKMRSLRVTSLFYASKINLSFTNSSHQDLPSTRIFSFFGGKLSWFFLNKKLWPYFCQLWVKLPFQHSLF